VNQLLPKLDWAHHAVTGFLFATDCASFMKAAKELTIYPEQPSSWHGERQLARDSCGEF